MSLIYLKSEDNASGSSSLNKPYNFTNFFTNPIKLKPDSQIAYINSSFDLNNAGNIDTTTFYYENGLDELNPVLPLSFKNRLISEWVDVLNEMAVQLNNQETDGDYTPIYTRSQNIGGTLQTRNIQGFNWYYILSNGTDGNVDISRLLRGINNEFNQGYNCLGVNTSFNIVAGGAGNRIFPAGINSGTGDNSTTFTEGGFYGINASNGTARIFQPASQKMPIFNNGNDPANIFEPAPPSNYGDFYSTSYAYLAQFFPAPYNPNFDSAFDNPVELSLPYDDDNWSLMISGTGIKKFVGMSDNGANKTDAPSIPFPNGNMTGHISISESNLSSGGYVNWTYNNQLLANAERHYDTPFLGEDGAGFNKVEGFCGIYPNWVGVQSLNFIRSLGSDLQQGLQNFCNTCDLNNSTSPTTPQGATARYLFGMRMYEERDNVNNIGSVYIQPQVLDPSSDIKNSSYIDVGEPLDLYEIAKGKARDYRDGDINQFKTFGNTESYYINVVNDNNLTNPARIYFRFRWTSPYTMALEYTLKEYVNVDENAGGRLATQGYSDETNTPYENYDYTDGNLGSFTGDPRNNWIIIADMKVPNGSKEGDNNYKQYFLPSYLGDMAFVCSTSFGGIYTNGYYDIRRQNRNNDLFNNLYFTSTEPEGYILSTLIKDGNDNNNSSEKLKGYDMLDIAVGDNFNFDEKGNSGSGKVIKFLMNEIFQQIDNNVFYNVNGKKMFRVFQPEGLRVGLQLGYMEDLDTATIELVENPTDDRYYSLASLNDITLGDDAFTQHFQIKNLPVQSQNGVISSQNKTIYVVNSLSLNQHIDTQTSKIYSHQAPVLLWVDINNKEEIMLSNMNVLITDDKNREQKLLVGETDVVFMVREKPKMITM